MAAVPWAQPLLKRIPPNEDLTYDWKPLLFELRFAGEIHRRGLAATYEYTTGVGDATVDFRIVDGQTEWLIELVSVLTSDAVKRATTHADPFFWTELSTGAQDPTQSEEGELILVQQKIGEKVYTEGQPRKFPPPAAGSHHVILADIRGFGITGGDLWDYREIAYGPGGLHGQMAVFQHYWKDNDGTVSPILGLFDPANTKQRAAKTIQQRVHFLGFCNDQEYTEGSIPRHTYYLSNPKLFAPADAGAAAYRRYPLRAPDQE